ncbi:GNAT family N-acetyltransferase [Paenibacillus silvae]|uniref:GCN5 family N-acetyltransferase n=1 Tax=Paenibacillus silvae TaxID=1325358 RepID=A0ABQ1ZMU3_9BACL|nr:MULTISPECIES: GNAT family N-acetyltransferase [Paenibacillus]MCK6078005.1 GNAT family N-acetyltransferase [Paenibacillus silvae]MCK6152204.1 GNAT family N-acetyltransferase [Paenibacillus silvae]MCK6270888.1 GNAT family N-acetyltransferase [Paenibacillus silvae]GGH69511.1 GCN5 family N-acetyltransferase [Paenibacillus silvae]
MLMVPYREQDHAKLVAIWERAVRATHTFLEEHHILFYKQMVSEVLEQEQVEVWEVLDAEQEPMGFIGLDNSFIEMLFVDEHFQGQGVGKFLVFQTMKMKGTELRVDVNEQNEGAARFYAKMGFVQIGRSELDGSGNPFPLLHLEMKRTGG